MKIKVVKRRDMFFRWIVGHTFNVLEETPDKKGYLIELPIGCCRVEKEECEVVTEGSLRKEVI